MPASGRVIPSTVGVRGLPGVLLTLGYAVMIWAGVYGLFFEPVTSASAVLGYSLASIAWNFSLIGAGIIGLASRIRRLPRVEVIAVETLAVVLYMWALFIFLTPEISDQSGYLLVAVGTLLFGWAAGTRRFLDHRTRVLNTGGDETEQT